MPLLKDGVRFLLHFLKFAGKLPGNDWEEKGALVVFLCRLSALIYVLCHQAFMRESEKFSPRSFSFLHPPSLNFVGEWGCACITGGAPPEESTTDMV